MAENKLKLSKNVLEMKFMKKYKEKAEKDAEREETSMLFNSEMSDVMIKGGDQCIFEPSYVPCEQLQFGRVSFNGMNPEIENLMRDNQLKNLGKLKAMDGISPREMAKRYSTLVNTLGKKFTPKRQQDQQDDDDDVSPKKLKFLKPST